jgi:hypothetical protein
MIHLLWCTIRPEVFKQMHPYWIGRSKNPNNVKTHVAVNFSQHEEIISDYFNNNNLDNRLITVKTNKIGVCYPSYQLSSTTEGESSDIIVFASDDFLPPQNWDEYLINKLNGKGDVCLMVRDGYQLPDSSNMLHPAITIPIMTFGCLRKMNGVIYHPAYSHMFSDCELYDTAKDLGVLYDDRLNDNTIFEHLHYAAGKRNADSADQAYNAKWKEDEITWNKRKVMSVEERILVNEKN